MNDQIASIAADFSHDQAAEAADAIAREHLGLRTLETRNSDDLDFHDMHVGSIRRALEAAFSAGVETALVAADTAEDHAAENKAAQDDAAYNAEVDLMETAAHADTAERCAKEAAEADDAEAAITAAARAARNAQKANASAEKVFHHAKVAATGSQAAEFAADARRHAERAQAAAAEAMKLATGWHAE